MRDSNSFESPIQNPDGALPQAAFEVAWQELDGIRMVTLTGELDLSAKEQLTFALNAPVVNVDLSGVTFMDSTALRCLVEAKENSHDFEIVPSVPVLRVIEVSGMGEFFGL